MSKRREYFIIFRQQFYIATVGVATLDNRPRAVWCERDDSVICLMGEEQRVIDPRQVALMVQADMPTEWFR